MEARSSVEQPTPVDLSAIIHWDNSSLLQLMQDLENGARVVDDMSVARETIHGLALSRLTTVTHRLSCYNNKPEIRAGLEEQEELLMHIVALTRTSGHS